MSKIRPNNIQYTTFIGDSVRGLLFEVGSWMDSYTISKERPNSFYFLDMTYHNDSEIGDEIVVYHGNGVE